MRWVESGGVGEGNAEEMMSDPLLPYSRESIYNNIINRICCKHSVLVIY